MLDPEHSIEIKLARASGNGSGVRVEPHEVQTILEWKRKADGKGYRGDANSVTTSLAISQGLDRRFASE